MTEQLAQKMLDALNRLTKWRSVFAAWQLGTRSINDPECQAVRDHREVTIMLRAEQSAFLMLLLDKGVFTIEEFQASMIKEARLLSQDYEKKFPGMKATDDGIQYDVKIAAKTMAHWRP